MTFKDKKQKDNFILDNIWIVNIIISRYFKSFYTIQEDLTQSAIETLIRCVNNYKEEYNVTFLTYAYKSILLHLRTIIKDYRYGDYIKLEDHRTNTTVNVLSLDYNLDKDTFKLMDPNNLEYNVTCKELLDSILLYTAECNKLFLQNEQNRKIIFDYYIKDYKQIDIARKLNISKQRVNNILKKYNTLIMNQFSKDYHK